MYHGVRSKFLCGVGEVDRVGACNSERCLKWGGENH